MIVLLGINKTEIPMEALENSLASDFARVGCESERSLLKPMCWHAGGTSMLESVVAPWQ